MLFPVPYPVAPFQKLISEFLGKRAPRPIKLAAEGDITSGALRANDAYDLELWKYPNGDIALVLFMKVQFFFEKGSGGDWTPQQKKAFMFNWRTAVSTAWNRPNLKRLKNGRHVSLRVDFALQEGGWMFDHWEITVTNIKPGEFRTSYVNVGAGTVTLDSEDLTPVNKGGGPGNMQRGALHEFGHMLGLDDEYPATSPHAADKLSVMNSSEQVRARHVVTTLKWLEAKLKALGIE